MSEIGGCILGDKNTIVVAFTTIKDNLITGSVLDNKGVYAVIYDVKQGLRIKNMFRVNVETGEDQKNPVVIPIGTNKDFMVIYEGIDYVFSV